MAPWVRLMPRDRVIPNLSLREVVVVVGRCLGVMVSRAVPKAAAACLPAGAGAEWSVHMHSQS
jgi:hypothetical protein